MKIALSCEHTSVANQSKLELS